MSFQSCNELPLLHFPRDDDGDDNSDDEGAGESACEFASKRVSGTILMVFCILGLVVLSSVLLASLAHVMYKWATLAVLGQPFDLSFALANWGSSLTLLFFPLVVVIYALLQHYAGKLAWDSTRPPVFPRVRAYCAVGLSMTSLNTWTSIPGWSVDFFWFTTWPIVLFPIMSVTCVVGLDAECLWENVLSYYVFPWYGITLMLFIASDAVIHGWGEHAHHRLVRRIEKLIVKRSAYPGGHIWDDRMFPPTPKCDLHIMDYTAFVWICIGGLGIWWCGIVFYYVCLRDKPWRFYVMGFVLFCSCISTAVGISRILKTLRKPRSFHATLFVYGVMSILLLFYSSRSGNSLEGSDVEAFVSADANSFVAKGRTAWVNEITSPYPVCLMRWSKANLTILDLAAMSAFAYTKQGSHGHDKLIQNLFNGTGITAKTDPTFFDGYTDTQQRGTPRVTVTRLSHTAGETIVVAVKGTDLVHDVYTDLSLWAGVVAMQIGSFFVPVLDVLPNDFVARTLRFWSGRSDLSVKLEREFVWHVAKQVAKLKKDSAHSDIIMTGHSLGGGLVTIVGSQMLVPSVVFSAPGAHFSRARFLINMERQYRNVVKVVPDSDLIARVDRDDGMVQHIECRKNDTHYEHRLRQCHSLKHTFCELWRACGDPRRRDFAGTCDPYVPNTVTELGQYFAGHHTPQVGDTNYENYAHSPDRTFEV